MIRYCIEMILCFGLFASAIAVNIEAGQVMTIWGLIIGTAAGWFIPNSPKGNP